MDGNPWKGITIQKSEMFKPNFTGYLLATGTRKQIFMRSQQKHFVAIAWKIVSVSHGFQLMKQNLWNKTCEYEYEYLKAICECESALLNMNLKLIWIWKALSKLASVNLPSNSLIKSSLTSAFSSLFRKLTSEDQSAFLSL